MGLIGAAQDVFNLILSIYAMLPVTIKLLIVAVPSCLIFLALMKGVRS